MSIMEMFSKVYAKMERMGVAWQGLIIPQIDMTRSARGKSTVHRGNHDNCFGSFMDK